MPIARVQLPDGRIGRFEVPEGTTPLQAEAFAFEQFKAGKLLPPPDAIEKSAIAAQKPSGLERLGRGFADVVQGGKQLALTAGEAVGLVDPGSADKYTAEKTAELQTYEQGRGKDAGFDWMRLAGNVVATFPVGGVGGQAVKLGARAAVGAGQGAVASATMFTPEGESKIAQTLIGAGFGAAVPAVIEGGKRALMSLASKARPQVVALPQLQQELTIELQRHGVDFGKLTGEVQRSLLEDAQRAVKVGGALDPAALQRKAVIESVGAKPTRAAVTRAPEDWRTEMNLRGIDKVGKPIEQRHSENAVALTDYLGRLRAQTGGKATTPYEAGESAVKAIKAQDAEAETAVSKLYDAFRSTGAQNAAVPDTKIADTLGRVADEIGTENIPPAVLSRLKEFGFVGGERTKLLTVNEADKLNRLLNNNNPGHGPGSLAIGKLKQALNEAIMEVPGDGSQALMTARQAAADRFAQQRASSGVSAAIDDVAPDKFVQKFILNADVKDLRGTLATLKKSPEGAQAILDIKGHLLDNLLMKATGATTSDDVVGKPFSGVRFSKALDGIAPEKLHQIFTPAELQSLRTLQKASRYLTEEVPFSDVNHSKTAAALANLLQKVGSTPLLGQIVAPIIGVGKIGADWVKDATARKQVAEALLGSAATAGNKAPLPVYQLERFAPAPAAAVLNQASQRPNE